MQVMAREDLGVYKPITVLIDEAEAGNTVRPTTLSTTPSAAPAAATYRPTISTTTDKDKLTSNGNTHAQTKPNGPSKDSSQTTESVLKPTTNANIQSSSSQNEKKKDPSTDSTPKQQLKPDSNQSDKVITSVTSQESGSKVSPHVAAAQEPFQFIDEPEDQSVSNGNLYSTPSIHQSEDLKAHEQMNLPEHSQDIDPSIVEDTYDGGPVVPSSAVQLNTPLGPVVMGEVSPINSNFNPAEVQNDQPPSEECFCPKKVCDAKADVVFLVDGSSDIPQVYFTHVLDFMKALTRGFSSKDTQLTTIGLGKLANVKELIDISSEPKSSHVFTAFLDTLPDILDDIVKGVCSDIKGKLNDKSEGCVCQANKVKVAKLKSPESLSEPSRAIDEKIPSTTKPSHETSDISASGNKSTNQSTTHSSDFKGTQISKEKSKAEQSHGDTHDSQQSPKSTDSPAQSLESEPQNKEQNKGSSSGDNTSKLQGGQSSKQPVQEKASQSKENPAQLQQQVSQSQEKSSSKGNAENTLIKEAKPDMKVDSPVPQIDRNEKGVPKKDDKEENNVHNNSAQASSNSSPMDEQLLMKIPVAYEQPKSQKDSEHSNPSKLNKESINVLDNGNTKTSKENSKSASELSPSTSTDQNTEASHSSNVRVQQLGNKTPSSTETSRETSAAEPKPSKDQQQNMALPSKQDNSSSNVTDSKTSKETGETTIPEKVIEATESSSPSVDKTKPKQQPQESLDEQKQGHKMPGNSKSSEELQSGKTTALQVEVPNPSSKLPQEHETREQEKKKPSEEEQKGKPDDQQFLPGPASESQPPQRPGFSILTSLVSQGSGASEQPLPGSNGQQYSQSGVDVKDPQTTQSSLPQNTTPKENTADIALKDCSINLGVVLDSKTTAYGEDIHAKKLLQLAKNLTHMFPVSPEGNRVGMMVYSGSPKLKVVHFDHSLDQSTMDKAIDSASYLNMEIKTAVILSLQFSAENGKRGHRQASPIESRRDEGE
ncbi:hypothetical protein QZH41_016965 [Actinostola sp. cb2023]|nr:hypothetical protein QZH41_016965 [Actinostola sp. cb2023]